MRLMDLLQPDKPFELRLLGLIESTDKSSAFQGKTLVELVRQLESDGNCTKVFATLHGREVWLSGKRRHVKVWCDWPDYSPLVNGEPNAHYRIEIRNGKSIVREERIASVEEAARVLHGALPV